MEKKFAILGDIHSNLDALEAVLDDCRKEGVTDFLCTGDVVGYNACPRECLKIIRDLGCPVVMGNHDYYVSSWQDLTDFNPAAAEVIEWTRKQLTDEEISILRSFPFVSTNMGITLVHSTMDCPESFGYVFDHLQAEAHFSHQITPICFHGHTHCPMIYEKQVSAVYRIDAQDFKLPIGRKYFINVGSVGQPRDGDSRAAYALWEPSTRKISFRRLEYDVQAAQERIRAAGLPERLASRLSIGR
ncbi:MAG: metallophosphoesterase family protein [Kiritimatiellae bacterium]|jgi:diadenosine tetraphosphatase ApaH/serine/threonine PP2A family protein phosphatase|nr:metallophosphoesterase family protein [Kiritimatiellia bacterium]